jgi:methylated-DNA-[protein]-cysteine S-methyltransferase
MGKMAIVWGEEGVVALLLPAKTEALTRKNVLAASPGAVERKPPEWVKANEKQLVSHLLGRAQDFSAWRLDLGAVTPFRKQVYEALKTVGWGKVCTYGDLAVKLGKPGAARAVGQALANNPFPVVVPCHRALASNGKSGGFSAPGGVDTKRRLLALEKGPLFGGEGALPFDAAAATAALGVADARLAQWMARVGPCALKLRHGEGPFVSLAESIVYQQLSGRAAASIFQKFLALFKKGLSPRALLRLSDEQLRSAGLSRGKVASLRDLAQKTLDGVVPTAEEIVLLSDEELIERLTQVRGIGRWTVEMMLIFHLGRPDVMPATDYGIRKAFARIFRKKELPPPAEILEYSERWKPHRTVASWYLWRSLDA